MIAFQGERGAFSEEALVRYFGPWAEPLPCRTFADAFDAVSSGRAALGLVPVENSQGGTIVDVYDLLRQHRLHVTGEICHAVEQCLMALPGQGLGDIRRVISHPQALAQVDQYLRHLGVEVVATYDTAGSARMIREEGLQGVAAVASVRAAELYGLELLARSIQTVKENVTRFVAISPEAGERQTGPQKTMLVMAVSHTPGSLYYALGALASRGINLLKIESRPSREKPWEYVFYLEFVGHRDDLLVREAMVDLEAHTTFLKTLGSFSRG